MKRFLSISFLAIALVVGTTGIASVVHAVGEADGSLPDTGGTLGGLEDLSASEHTHYESPAAAAAAATADAEIQKANNKAAIDTDPNSPYNAVMIKIMSLFAWLVGAAAIVLDYAVYYTVVTMGAYVKNLSAIGVTWTILRDIGNIFLIFGFIAVGITTILNVDWYGGGKKMLPMMFMAAIFLNFSLFFAEAIIDTGNLFATQFYTQIKGGPTSLTPPSISMSSVSQEGISNKIMNQLGLQTLYGNGTVNKDLFAGNSPWLVGFMGILLFITTAFVMFALAFILIARFVALIFLIILAPVGFAGLAVPMLAKRASQWWSTLFEQTITAPILMLMLYVALRVITDVNFLTGFGAATTGTGPSPGASTGFVGNADLPGFGGFLLSFIVAMGLLLVVVIQAKNLSAFGAGWATKTAGALSFGATAWAGRNSVGWGANRLAKMARSSKLGRIPLLGTGITKGLEGVAKSSFDVRGSGVLKSFPGSNIDAGEAQEGGYKADLKERVESRTKYAEDLKGRELTEDEKVDQKVAQNNIKATETRLATAQMRQRRVAAQGGDTQEIDDEIAAEKQLLAGHKEKLEKLESVTDKGAKLDYAKSLNLWTDEKNFFNKYINFAANTDAAKKIREEAKKSKDDKTLDSLKKALKKASGDEEHAAAPTAAPAAPTAAPADDHH